LWAGGWLELRQRPERIKTLPAFNLQHPQLPNILAYGIKRLALNDAAGAVDVWQTLRATQPFTAAHITAVNRSLALALAAQNDPQASVWLGALDSNEEDQRVRERRVLLAMNSGDWSATLTWISQLSVEEQTSSRWRYWQARALGQLGFPEQAAGLYARLIGRDYYGFLAADRLGQPYTLIHRPLLFSAEDMAVVERMAGIARAREFYALGRLPDTRREWNYTLQNLDEPLKLRAAQLAHSWGWRDGAIFTLAQAPRQDDLELLFPLDHREHVELRAKDSAIDPAWAFAIMRQESAFVADARSPVGALGLMQLMPATARMVAKELKMKLKNIDNLLLPEVNVRLGTAYLRTGLDRFAANPVLATAAYNAGVGRVRQWLPAPCNTISAELWVENIPFKETRDYVRRVMAFTVIYQYRLGGEPVSLSKIMLPIGEEPATVMDPAPPSQPATPNPVPTLKIIYFQ
jgi:soluble lytic murein transglycosylase